MSGAEDDDNKVGYGNPPKHTQFKKGQSGNPKGRQKGSRNFNTDLDEVLKAFMTVSENGKPKKVSAQLAMLMRLREQALNGDPRALGLMITLATGLSAEKEAQSAERVLNAEEGDILARFEADLLRGADSVAADVTAEDESDA